MNDMMKVLIPLDGSTLGDSILLPIDPLIRGRQVESTLFHVLEAPGAVAPMEARLEARRKAMEDGGLKARVRIASGRPAEAILRELGAGGYDLVAMATHGRTGLDRVLMGSVAEEVMRSSPVPSLLCRGGARVGVWDRMVVALDGTPGSEEILVDVVPLAKRLGAVVHLLHVGLGLLWSDGYRGSKHSVPKHHPKAHLEEIAARLNVEGVQAVPEHREGMAGPEILELARNLEAGLICMATEGRPEEVPGLDRSIAAEVIRGAPCPVYVRRMTPRPGGTETRRKAAHAG